MIDWLTLRTPLQRISGADRGLADHLLDKLQGAAGVVVCYGGEGQEVWSKIHFDFEKLRSDTPGLFWTIQNTGGNFLYLVVGGSPASIEHGANVFGSSDIQHCARVLVRHSRRVLQSWLPDASDWECRRIDVTENYALDDAGQCKQALSELLRTARARRYKASSVKDTDTVAFNPTSDLRAGKIYHKGPQLDYLSRKGGTNATGEQIQAAMRLLRAELKLGARWCRRLEESYVAALTLDQKKQMGADAIESAARAAWWNLTESDLSAEHESFFGGLWGDVEVKDMEKLLERLDMVAPSKGQALAAHRTWALIRAVGTEQAKCSMPLRTWQRHCKLLKAAGLSDADLCCAEILPFVRRRVFVTPVRSWEELRRCA